jgi:hypothetical protein
MDEALAFWQRRCARPLECGDARQIATNMTGFFRVLLDWEERDRSDMTTGKIEDSKADDH